METGNVTSFGMGMVCGAMIIIVSLMLGDTPQQVEKRWQREATKRGYGGMVLEGDEFVWRWNEEVKANESQ